MGDMHTIQHAVASAAVRTRQADGHHVFFHQGCPVCGRRLEINVELLGRRVFCQHCGGGFIAMDASMQPAAVERRETDRSDKVDELLERAALLLEQAGSGSGDRQAGPTRASAR